MNEPRLVRPGDRSKDTAQTSGMAREAAISSARIWSGFVRAAPGMDAGWHHHGDHETSVFMLSGRARFEFGPGGSGSIEAEAGDFIHVPAHAIHRESNPYREEATFVVTRAGTGTPVINVDGPAAE